MKILSVQKFFELQKELVIIPDRNEKELPDNIRTYRISYTYLHGQLESDCGYDIFGFRLDFPDYERFDNQFYNTGDTGNDAVNIYSCTYNGKPCTLFLWYAKAFKRYKGLAVYNDDKAAWDYAFQCYNNAEECI